MPEHDFDWIVEPFDGPVDLAPGEPGEFEAILATHVSADLGYSGGHSGARHGPDDVASEVHIEVKYGSDAPSWIILIPSPDGARILVVGRGEPDAAIVDAWASAIRSALTDIGQKHTSYEWSAIIGPFPPIETGGKTLGEPATVGPLALRPGETPLWQWVNTSGPSIIAFQNWACWPLFVDGASPGFDWRSAFRGAGRDLYTICALVSIAWNEGWRLLEIPREKDVEGISIPENTPPGVNAGTPAEAPAPGQPLPLPPWLDAAWAVLEGDHVLRAALSAHYEGLLLEPEHPSFALTAFIASVEAIGTKVLKLERCKECGSVKGSGKRFRETLRFGVQEALAQELSRLYKQRSATVHRGELHGLEPVSGLWSSGGFFGSDPSSDFVASARKMRYASRNVLVRALTSGIP